MTTYELHTARERVGISPKDAAALSRKLSAELAAAGGHTDPNLSAEGLTAKRAELARTARQRADAALGTLRSQLTSDSKALGEFAEQRRPRVDADTMSRKWEQVRMRLDAGIPVQRIVAKADAETLAAIREYGDAWFETQHQSHQPSGVMGSEADTTASMEQLNNSIDARLIEVGDDHTKWAVEADREARSAVAVFEQHAAHIGRLVAGTASSSLESSVAAHFAGQAAGAALAAE